MHKFSGLIPSSPSCFCAPAFFSTKAAIVTTLSVTGKLRNRADRGRQTAADHPNSGDTPRDERIPIGPGDVISMQPAHIIVSCRDPALVLIAELAKHLSHHDTRRLAQGAVRHVSRIGEQLLDSFLARLHAASISFPFCRVHSYFPTILIDCRHCGPARSIRHA